MKNMWVKALKVSGYLKKQSESREKWEVSGQIVGKWVWGGINNYLPALEWQVGGTVCETRIKMWTKLQLAEGHEYVEQKYTEQSMLILILRAVLKRNDN